MKHSDFQSVVEENTDFVYNVAYRMMGNAQDAEDITQEAFLSAYRGWASFRGGSSVSTWLYRITVNACLMRLRKEKRARASTERAYRDGEPVDWADSLPASPQESPEGIALSSELRQEIQSAITELPPDLRAAVVVRDIQELSNTEAADALGISVSALKARLHRGRVLLRKRLEEYLKTLG